MCTHTGSWSGACPQHIWRGAGLCVEAHGQRWVKGLLRRSRGLSRTYRRHQLLPSPPEGFGVGGGVWQHGHFSEFWPVQAGAHCKLPTAQAFQTQTLAGNQIAAGVSLLRPASGSPHVTTVPISPFPPRTCSVYQHVVGRRVPHQPAVDCSSPPTIEYIYTDDAYHLPKVLII